LHTPSGSAGVLYPPHYYPGSSNRSDAIVLELGSGQHITDLTFALPAPLSEERVEQSVTVLWPDGRPASGAMLSVADQHWPDYHTGELAWITNAAGQTTLKLRRHSRYSIYAYTTLGARQTRTAPAMISTEEKPAPLTLVLNCDSGKCGAATPKQGCEPR
jgi:hypothetical protein